MTSNETTAGLPDVPVWQPQMIEAQESVADAQGIDSGPEIETLQPATDDFELETRPVARRKSGRRAGSTSLLLVLGALIAMGGIAFAVGRATGGASSATSVNRANGFGPNASGNPGLRDGFGGGASVTGTVESITADSMTIKTASGQSITISLGSSTTYHSQTSASASSVVAGTTVSVKTSGGGNPQAGASPAASPGTGGTNRTATDVTITK